MSDRDEVVQRLTDQLDQAASLRNLAKIAPETAAARLSLRAWQGERLARTHADLLASPHFGRAATFFLSDIYGLNDVSKRDAAIKRIVPIMTKLLPLAGLVTVADAVELDALSESLDAAVVAVLGPKLAALDAMSYAGAYREVGRRKDRERQIELIAHLGHALDQLARQPFIGATLAMMRRPAKLMGLGELQDVLDRGYEAVRGMDDIDAFLELIVARESQLMRALFAGGYTLLLAEGKPADDGRPRPVDEPAGARFPI
jgi:hypothetical protein